VSRLRTHARIAVFGLALGLVLARSGFTDLDELHRMFLLQNGRLLLTYLGGVAVAGAGFALLASRGPALPSRPVHPGTVPGGILFGVGWALSGGCPAAVLVQLGEGKPLALATALGILGGTWAAQRVRERIRWDAGSCAG
jgi:uncharacterized membrane protein YedE/YeeE